MRKHLTFLGTLGS